MQHLKRLAGVFFARSIGIAVRGSFLFVAVMLLVSSSSSWKYVASSLLAHDMQRSAAWAGNLDLRRVPLTIAIDDTGYQNYFDARSPLSRERLLALLKTVAAHTRATTRIAIDIDLSPVAAQAADQARLEHFIKQDATRWILPAVQPVNDEQALGLATWSTALCAQGVSFGLPYVPTEFGYPKPTHQFAGSLAEVSRRGAVCADPTIPFTQIPMPLLPAYLKNGAVIPFSGDLDALAAALDAIDPEVVVLGGAWGQTDIFGTPFGERYGVQVHAAAIAGYIYGERLAPIGAELAVAAMFISFISTMLSEASKYLSALTGAAAPSMAGHQFFALRVKPVLLILLIAGLLLLLLEMLAVIHAHTAYWINGVTVCICAIVTMLVNWNLGRTEPARFHDWSHVWRAVIIEPMKCEIRSLRQAVLIASGRSVYWVDAGNQVRISAWRAYFECAFASISLLLQSVIPVFSLSYIVYKSF